MQEDDAVVFRLRGSTTVLESGCQEGPMTVKGFKEAGSFYFYKPYFLN